MKLIFNIYGERNKTTKGNVIVYYLAYNSWRLNDFIFY